MALEASTVGFDSSLLSELSTLDDEQWATEFEDYYEWFDPEPLTIDPDHPGGYDPYPSPGGYDPYPSESNLFVMDYLHILTSHIDEPVLPFAVYEDQAAEEAWFNNRVAMGFEFPEFPEIDMPELSQYLIETLEFEPGEDIDWDLVDEFRFGYGEFGHMEYGDDPYYGSHDPYYGSQDQEPQRFSQIWSTRRSQCAYEQLLAAYETIPPAAG